MKQSLLTSAKKNVQVDILRFLPRNLESPIDIYLAQGIARGEKMDFIIQKAVELGVKKIFPLLSERSNVKWNNQRKEAKLVHWRGIVISACEQSGRNQIPEISIPLPFADRLSSSYADHRFILLPNEPPISAVNNIKGGQSILLLIGPEGGFSHAEIESAIKSDFKPLNLGPRILRTETATIAAIAFFQSRFGDMRMKK